MSDRPVPASALPADTAAAVEVGAPEPLGEGFRPYQRYRLVLTHPDGAREAQERDLIRGGAVVGVLIYDPARRLLVLIRQFRLAAHLVYGRGEMVEIVAGGVEPGEMDEAAARRECREEIGLEPRRLIPLLRFLPTPGLTDESATLFLGIADTAALPQQAGADAEAERTYPFTISIDDALRLLESGGCANGYLLIALQWLALNRARLDDLASDPA